jgi:hypothetical protein
MFVGEPDVLLDAIHTIIALVVSYLSQLVQQAAAQRCF